MTDEWLLIIPPTEFFLSDYINFLAITKKYIAILYITWSNFSNTIYEYII